MGHFPQSIALSSVGGWVATRAAGQFSTKYGNIEDMLVAFEAVLPSGRGDPDASRFRAHRPARTCATSSSAPRARPA